MKQAILAAVTMILLASFSTISPSTSIDKNKLSLYGTKWMLKSMNQPGDSANLSPISNQRAFIVFDEAKMSAGGNASCNHFGSALSVDNDSINFRNIFSTKMYCEDVQQTENRYLELLGRVNSFRIEGSKLLLSENGKVILEFEG